MSEESSASGRATRRRDRRKAEIVAVALQQLATVGYQAMNLEDVAECVDIGKATLYHYFPGKDALVLDALRSLEAEVFDRLRAALDEVRSEAPPVALRTLVATQIKLLTEEYPVTGTLFSVPTKWPPQHSDIIKAMRQGHNAIFSAVVEAGVATGEFDCANPEVALRCLHGILNHASIWLRPANDVDHVKRDAVVTSCMRLFVSENTSAA